MLVPVHVEHERMFEVHAAERTDPVWRQKFALVEHVLEDAREALLRRHGEEPVPALALRHVRHVTREIFPVLEEPLHALLEAGGARR